jgi:hypothetical protein
MAKHRVLHEEFPPAANGVDQRRRHLRERRELPPDRGGAVLTRLRSRRRTSGRMLSAAAPTVIGLLSTKYGLGGALAFLAIAFVGGALSIYLLPETRGRELA